jgi:predicted dehydrogenase
MKKIRVLLLGAAFSADLHVDAYARIRDKAEIVAIADKDISRITALTRRYGIEGYKTYDTYEEAIEAVDCDLVDICLPNFLHHDPAMRALNKGRDIISEKPLATTVAHAEEMVRLAEEKGKHIYYAEDWLFSPAIRKALQTVEQGGIGKPVFIRARECHCGSHSPFAQKIQYCGGGSMIHLGIHPVGLMLSLKNNEWTELCAMTSGGGENNLVHRSMEGEDWAVLVEARERANVLTRGIIAYRKAGRTYRRSFETHRLRLYSARELAKQLRGIGFDVEVLAGYGRFKLPPAHAAFLARKA